MTDGVDVGAGDFVGPRDVVLEIDVIAEVHFVGDGAEDESLLTTIRKRELDLAVETARSKQRGIQRVGAVRRHDYL